MWLFLIFLIGSYLLGSVSSAVIACKIMGLPDPRSQGSGNPGATNVLRIAGKKLAIIVLLCDLLKGMIPVLIAKAVGLPIFELGWIALAAFLGHLFPIFFGFKGGKGVATAFGAIVALSWPLGLALLATWLAVAAVFRYSSLAALTTAVLAPVYAYWLLCPKNYLPVLIISVLLILRHHRNIWNLWKGQESKIGAK